jgi:hypothetical protein
MNSTCIDSTELFSNKLADVYISKYNTGDKSEIIHEIKEWLRNGTDSKVINSLFEVEFGRNFPIWWSGFFLEDPDPKKNPVNDMRNAAKKLNGFSSLDNIMNLTSLEEQNKFWSDCVNTPNFNTGTYISIGYTKYALKNKPQNIGLFLNKDRQKFLLTDFFKTEILLIDKEYSQNNKVTLHIFNLQDNCDEIIELLREYTQNIDFKCYQNCNNLTECVDKIQISNLGGKRLHKNKISKKKIKKSKKIKVKNKKYTKKTNY